MRHEQSNREKAVMIDLNSHLDLPLHLMLRKSYTFYCSLLKLFMDSFLSSRSLQTIPYFFKCKPLDR